MAKQNLIALKPIQVQLRNEDGSLKVREGENGKKVPVKELRQIGDPIPEAEHWPNLRAFVSSGDVGVSGSPAAIEVLATHPHLREKLAVEQPKAPVAEKKRPGPKPGAKKAAAKKAAASKAEPTDAGDETPATEGTSEGADTGEAG